MQMRRYLSLAAGLLAVAAGCKDPNEPTFVTLGPQAYVRYVNASPDSPSLTVRLVDRVENWRTADGVPFRGNSGYYVAVNAGQRQLRAFRLLGVAGNASLDTGTVVVLDTTFTLQEKTYYTIVQTGNVMPGRGQPGNNARITVYTDTVPAPSSIAADQIAVRAYHLAPGAGAVDVAMNKSYTIPANPNATPPTPAINVDSAVTGTIANVAPLTRSAYVTVPAVRLADSTAGTLYRFTVRPAGGTTTLVTARPANFPGNPALPASPTTPFLEAVAGPRLGRSALDLFVFPAAVPGSPAATAATATPTIDLIPANKPGS